MQDIAMMVDGDGRLIDSHSMMKDSTFSLKASYIHMNTTMMVNSVNVYDDRYGLATRLIEMKGQCAFLHRSLLNAL